MLPLYLRMKKNKPGEEGADLKEKKTLEKRNFKKHTRKEKYFHRTRECI